MRLRKPLKGFVYVRIEEGLVEVTAPDGRTGRFDIQARHLEGDLTKVTPHLVNWAGGQLIEQTEFENVFPKKGQARQEQNSPPRAGR
jgi:hypothetical protein